MLYRFLWLGWLAGAILGASLGFGLNPITGSVKDASGNTLNGAFVSANREGATFTTTVYSDDTGKFRFPELVDGTYTVTAHAGGFQASRRSNVSVKDGQIVALDFVLDVETRPAELLKQATASEWLASLPGTTKQKNSLGKNCGSCHHNIYQLRDYRFTKADWSRIISAMERINVIGDPQEPRPNRWRDGNSEEIAEYLAQVQGPNSPLPKIQFFPRPTGKATEAVITEYRIPRENAAPHDVYVDAQGNVWYNDFKTNYLGKLNPKTAEFKEYKLPPKPGVHPGSASMFIGEDQNVWVHQHLGGRVFRFDPRTEKVTGRWDLPEDADFHFVRVDKQREVALGIEMQMDLKTGKVLLYKYKSSISGYGNGGTVDSRGIGYRGGINDSVVRMVNPETGVVTNYPTPTPDSGPRRTSQELDWDGNLWFGEWYGGKIGQLDVKTGKITEYAISTPFAAFYTAGVDLKNQMAWAFEWRSDRLVRVNPKTGEVTEYPMPTLDVESRRTAVDYSTPTPSMWIHGAGNGLIIRVQTR